MHQGRARKYTSGTPVRIGQNRSKRMTAHQTQGEAFALADAFYAECQVVAKFIDEKLRLLVDERVGRVPHGVTFQVQLLRAIGWLRSLDKLNHPGDFQAVTAAARALFEGAVDVTLMHFDAASNGPEKMDAWELSAKLKHAQSIATYLSEAGRPPAEDEKTILAFLHQERTGADHLRLRWWPRKDGKPEHPSRWTGRDLGSDFTAGFEEFYRLRYPQICWNTHGSGAAGIANIAPEVFPFIGGMAYREAAKFASVVAEVVAKAMSCWNEADFTALREQVTLASGVVYVAHSGGVDR
jgi:hypothetical protein